MANTNLRLVQLDNDKRLKVLNKLGYDIDEEGFVINQSKERIICKYSNEKVHINTAAILPGSTIIINANALTMAQYFLERNSDD